MNFFIRNKKIIIITSLLCLLPIAFGLIFWENLPEMMPTHFNLNNEANGFMKKEVAVFLLPIFIAILELFCALISSLDPKSSNISDKSLIPILIAMPILSWICSAATYSAALGYKINIGSILITFSGILFVAIAIYLPNSSQNYTVGIKTAWALNDELNWKYTNKIASICFKISGIVITFIGIASFFFEHIKIIYIIFFVIIFACSFIPLIASLVYYKKHKS